MINSSLDILFLVLAAIILLVGVLLAIAIVYLIMILRDASKATYFIRDTAKQINDFVYKPIVLVNSILEKLGPVIEMLKTRGEDIAEAAVKKYGKGKKGKK